MQAETQNQAITEPQLAPVGESVESKSKRGGKRPGAGRKPNLAKRLLKGFSHGAIAEAVATVDCGAVIVGLLKSKRERTRLETLVFIRDTLDRPSSAECAALCGGVVHAHGIWPPFAYGNLTEEEAALLDKAIKKLSQPVLNASPDGHQNQTESSQPSKRKWWLPRSFWTQHPYALIAVIADPWILLRHVHLSFRPRWCPQWQYMVDRSTRGMG